MQNTNRFFATRRRFLRDASLSLLTLAITGCSESRLERKKPNIIFIMTDDQGPWAWGISGNKDAYTPNLDSLAKQGAYVKNCFSTCPVCSPARASLMTSRYASECGIPDYISRDQPDLGLDSEFVTWPEVFSDHGYATALVGKWHLGARDRYHPSRFGYQEFTGFRAGGRVSKDPEIEIDGEIKKVSGYTPDILTDHALDFIKRKQEKPFLLSLHFWAPHANNGNYTADGDRTWLPVRDEIWNRFKEMQPKLPQTDINGLDVERTKRMMREYLASIAAVDRNIKRVVDTLNNLGLTGNTVIIFTADQGFNMGHNGIWHKGNGKWLLKSNPNKPRPNLYDNSMRTPTLVYWPKTIKPGTIVEQNITNLDWYPTLLSMAGLPVPENTIIRGNNFFPLLRGRDIEWENDVFGQYDMWEWHQTGADLRTYRTNRYKLIRDFEHPDKDEFYDLINDPEERNNLIDSKNSEVRQAIEALQKQMNGKMKEIDDPRCETF
ncbi:MAG: sulfatase-like hydrolase/transferase [candidate division KSB1 bacterium]|nr:sulfatase-like hydrolase/transferase [candidate division KSB1 bacterium]